MKKFWFFLSSLGHFKMELFSPVCQKVTGEVIKIAFSVSVRTNWNKLFVEKHVFSLSLLDFKRNFFALIKFLSAEIVKTAFYVAIRTFWETILSGKYVFSIIFRIQWNFFRILMKFPLWGCQNCNIRVQANNLRKSFAFWKRCIFCQSRTLKKKLSPIFRVFLDAVVETAFYVSKGTLRGKRFFSGKNCIFSSVWEIETNFSNFCRNFYGMLIKFALYVSQQTIWGKKISEEILFCRSASLSEKFLTFCVKKSDGLSKLHFTSPVEHSQEKCKFLETPTFWWKNFDFFIIFSTQ